MTGRVRGLSSGRDRIRNLDEDVVDRAVCERRMGFNRMQLVLRAEPTYLEACAAQIYAYGRWQASIRSGDAAW
jgi:hypothetical protein